MAKPITNMLKEGLLRLNVDLEELTSNELEDSLNNLSEWVFNGGLGDIWSPGSFKKEMDSAFRRADSLSEIESDFKAVNARNAMEVLNNRPQREIVGIKAPTIDEILAPLGKLKTDELANESWRLNNRSLNSVPLAGIVDDPILSEAFSPSMAYHRTGNSVGVGETKIDHMSDAAKERVNFSSSYKTPPATFMSGRSNLPIQDFGSQLHPMLPFRDLEMLDLSKRRGTDKVWHNYDQEDINRIFNFDELIEDDLDFYQVLNNGLNPDGESMFGLPHSSLADKMAALLEGSNLFDGVYTSEAKLEPLQRFIPGDTFAIFDMDNVHQPFANFPKDILGHIEPSGVEIENLATKYFPRNNYRDAYDHMSDVFKKKGIE